MQAAGRHAPGGPRVSGTTVSLSGPSPRVLGPQVKARPLTGTPSALRSSCNARLFPGVPRPPQEDWARPFSFFSLFKLLTLELCTSFTICFQIFFFLQWRFSFGPCLPFSVFLQYGVVISLNFLLLLLTLTFPT